MRLRTIFLSVLLVIAISNWSCTDEPDSFEFAITTLNSSDSNIVMELYSTGSLYQANTIQSSESYRCSYNAEFFRGFSGCNSSNIRSIDSIVIKFENMRGYICVDKSSEEANQNCLPNKSLFISNENTFLKTGDTVFEFLLTQEDFENAFELPE